MSRFNSKIESESEISLQNKFRVSFTAESFSKYLQNRPYENSNSMMNYYTLDPTKTSTLPSEDSKTDIVIEQTSVNQDLVRDISGLWGSYGCQKSPWRDTKRPYSYQRKVGEFNDDEKAGILSKRMIAASLTYLERCPEYGLYALCKCVLSEKNINDISALRTYHFIQYLDLSLNKLTTLKALGEMPFLQHLDASGNAIENLLDFEPPLYLTFVNYSHNLISEIPDITDFWSIVHLDLCHNKISEIKGLQNLRFLNYLDLSENKIETLTNLSHLRIQTLLLSNNDISEIEEGDNVGLKTLVYLRNINLSNNYIESLHYFKHNALLSNVELSNNLVKNVMEIYNLENKGFLTQLNLSINPISTKKHYRELCIRTIPNLRVLDSEIVTNEERVELTINGEVSIDLEARESRLLLLYLEQINRPKIGNHIVPYDQPPPHTILIVGPPASNKKRIVTDFVKTHKRLIRGTSYTTRPPTEKEINGQDYYFVSPTEFQQKLNNGEFISLSEFNGHSYAIAYQELEKALDHHVILFYCDLMTGLSFKSMGLRPSLVLAIPRSEEIHLKWITKSYHCELIDSKYFQIRYGHKTEEKITEFVRKVIEKNLSFRLKHPVSETAVEDNVSMLDDSIHKFRQNSKGGILKKCSKESIRKKECSVMELSLGEISNNASNYTDNEEISIIWKNRLDHKKVSWIQNTDVKESVDGADPFGNYCFFANRGDQFPQSFASKECKSSDSILDKICKGEHTECMKKFQERVLKMRQDLLDMHWDNPGLFREIIFTEDKEESLNKLENMLKNIMEFARFQQNKEWVEDKSFEEMVNRKISRLDLQKHSYLDM